jgi:hypothetical protein
MFTACGGGGGTSSSSEISGQSSGTGTESSGIRLKSSKSLSATGNHKINTEYAYDGNKVMSAKGIIMYNNALFETFESTWKYKNNQIEKHIVKQYNPDKKLKMTTTTVVSYDAEKRPYKEVTESVQGTNTEVYIKTIIEKTKWEGRYPTEEKMSIISSGSPTYNRIWTVTIDNDRVESLTQIDVRSIRKYTYDTEDRREPLSYLLEGDTEKYGERRLTHEHFLVTNEEVQDLAKGTTKNEKTLNEFNELGLVIKQTILDGTILTYEYEEF